jgi:antitoxin CptB
VGGATRAIEPAGGDDSEAAAALRRLRWRARRGLLENDLVLARFLERHGERLAPAAVEALARLLELPDGELLDLILARRPAGAAQDGEAMRDLLALLRAA